MLLYSQLIEGLLLTLYELKFNFNNLYKMIQQNNNMNNIEDELKHTKVPPINGFPKGDTDHLMEMFKKCDPNAMKAKPSLMMLLHMSQEEYKQYIEQQKKYEVPDDGMGCIHNTI